MTFELLLACLIAFTGGWVCCAIFTELWAEVEADAIKRERQALGTQPVRTSSYQKDSS